MTGLVGTIFLREAWPAGIHTVCVPGAWGKGPGDQRDTGQQWHWQLRLGPLRGLK